MTDKNFYTAEGIKERVGELRAMKMMLLDEEARLLTIYEAALHYKCPVDSCGRPMQKPRSTPRVPARAKPALQYAIRTGSYTALPGYQDWHNEKR